MHAHTKNILTTQRSTKSMKIKASTSFAKVCIMFCTSTPLVYCQRHFGPKKMTSSKIMKCPVFNADPKHEGHDKKDSSQNCQRCFSKGAFSQKDERHFMPFDIGSFCSCPKSSKKDLETSSSQKCPITLHRNRSL